MHGELGSLAPAGGIGGQKFPLPRVTASLRPRPAAHAPSSASENPHRSATTAAQANERALSPARAASPAAPPPAATLEGLSQRDAAVLVAAAATGFALLAGDLVLWHHLSSLDAGVHAAVRAHASPELRQWARSTLSNAPIVTGWGVWAAATATLAAAVARGDTRSDKAGRAVRHMAIAAAGYLAGGGTIQQGDPWLVDVLKHVFQRARPSAGSSTYAFPSGHATAGAFMGGALLFVVLPAVAEAVGADARTAAALRRLRPAAWVACAAATAGGRVLADVHWATDVAAGGFLGAALVAATALACSAADAAAVRRR